MGFKNSILALVLVLGFLSFQAASRELQDLSMSERHEQWMSEYGRIYKDETEKTERFMVFKNNLEFIESFNNGGSKPYKLGLNAYADLTNEEFRASRNGYKLSLESNQANHTPSFKYENITSISSWMDWRQKGAVTHVKDQGQCGNFHSPKFSNFLITYY